MLQIEGERRVYGLLNVGIEFIKYRSQFFVILVFIKEKNKMRCIEYKTIWEFSNWILLSADLMGLQYMSFQW